MQQHSTTKEGRWEDQRPVGQRVRRGRFFERDQPEDALWREAGEERGRYEAEETRRGGTGGIPSPPQPKPAEGAERAREREAETQDQDAVQKKDWKGKTRSFGEEYGKLGGGRVLGVSHVQERRKGRSVPRSVPRSSTTALGSSGPCSLLVRLARPRYQILRAASCFMLHPQPPAPRSRQD